MWWETLYDCTAGVWWLLLGSFLMYLWIKDVLVHYSYVVYWGDDGIRGFNTSPCPVLLVGKSRLVLVAVQGAPQPSQSCQT